MLLQRFAEAEAGSGGEGSADGEDAGQEHGIVGSSVPEKMEEEGDESSHETGCCEHASSTAGTVVGCGTEQHVVVGRLEETESGTAHHKPPCDVHM